MAMLRQTRALSFGENLFAGVNATLMALFFTGRTFNTAFQTGTEPFVTTLCSAAAAAAMTAAAIISAVRLIRSARTEPRDARVVPFGLCLFHVAINVVWIPLSTVFCFIAVYHHDQPGAVPAALCYALVCAGSVAASAIFATLAVKARHNAHAKDIEHKTIDGEAR